MPSHYLLTVLSACLISFSVQSQDCIYRDVNEEEKRPGANCAPGRLLAADSPSSNNTRILIEAGRVENDAAPRLQSMEGDQPEPQAGFSELEHLVLEASEADQANNSTRALALLDRAQPLANRLHGEGSQKSLDILAARASLQKRLGQLTAAATLWQMHLALARIDAPDRVSLAAYNLGEVLEKAGIRDGALAAFGEALIADEARYGKDHFEVAADLGRIGILHQTSGRLSEARQILERTLVILEQQRGVEHTYTLSVLNRLASIDHDSGVYGRAIERYQRILSVREKVPGPDHPETAEVLGNLALSLKAMGRYDEALPLYQRALAIDEKTLGPEHPATATDLNNLASLFLATGRHDEALGLHRRALASRQMTFGVGHPRTRSSLANLSALLTRMGEYDKALDYALQALEIAEKSPGPEHPDTAASLLHLANLQREIGQYAQALPYAERALAIYEKVHGANHHATAWALGHIADLQSHLGHPDVALPFVQRAVAIAEQTLGPLHLETADVLNSLGLIQMQLGQRNEALASFERALNIHANLSAAGQGEQATVLNNLAVTRFELGQQEAAVELLRQAIAIHREIHGKRHPKTGAALANLAFRSAASGHFDEALTAFEESNAIAGETIERVFAIASEQEKLAYVENQQWRYDGQLSLVSRHFATDKRALRRALDLVLARKGIVFDAQARQNEAIAGSLDSEARVLWDELASQRARQARLMRAQPNDPALRERELHTLDETVAALERKLAGLSAAVAGQLEQRNFDHAVVASRLPTDGLLVEWVRIADVDWPAGRWSGRHRYLAFLLRANGDIRLIDVADADEIDRAIQSSLRRLERIGHEVEDQLAAARELHILLWQPLAKAVGNAGTVVFSPDGQLNLVPFAALMDADGRFFVENHATAYLTSGRELARTAMGRPDRPLFLVANPAFNAGPVQSHDGQRFLPLPGTQDEADFIPTLFQGENRVVTGAAATESEVRLAGRPRVLHLATHGFFLADTARPGPGTRGAMPIGEDPAPRPAAAVNPLLRSGLALAGANHAGQARGGDDGLLTALEVSGMSLHGTDLVTLSACETGRGDVKSGEGVFGLRRAFALSGARHLVMSLWPVGDEATAQQMRVFYRQYGSGARPAEALRAAQLASIETLRMQGKVAEPALWAPFIAQGW
jgi:CHAT domain-containing protein/tetratricopeptide (TPR) repeat protein